MRLTWGMVAAGYFGFINQPEQLVRRAKGYTLPTRFSSGVLHERIRLYRRPRGVGGRPQGSEAVAVVVFVTAIAVMLKG